MSTIDIIIPVLNEELALPRCIATLKDYLRKNINQPWTITIVDNGSEDGSVDFFKKEKYDNLSIIENRENLGYSRGFNTGINEAMKLNPDYILIHNNDIVFDRNALKSLVKHTFYVINSFLKSIMGTVFFVHF